MPLYLISFDDGAMAFPEEDLPDVSEAAHAVVREAKNAGVWVLVGGVNDDEDTGVVTTDGTVTHGPYAVGKSASAESRSSTCPPARRRWCGLPSSPAPAVAREVREFLIDSDV